MITALILIMSAVFLVLAALSNARMDITAENFSSSIYAGKEKQWFNNDFSYTNKRNFEQWDQLAKHYLPSFVYKLSKKFYPNKVWDPLSDFWHFEKCKMLIFLWLSSVSFSIFIFLTNQPGWVTLSIVVFSIAAAVKIWTACFNFFYEKKLRK